MFTNEHFTLHIQMVRVGYNWKLDPRFHIGPNEFKSLGRLPVSRRVDQIVLNNIFKIKSGKSADYMSKHFVPVPSVHSYGTRFRENGCFSIRKVKGFVKKSFAYNGCILWNDLPKSIKEFEGIHNFKMAVKEYCFRFNNIIA